MYKSVSLSYFFSYAAYHRLENLKQSKIMHLTNCISASRGGAFENDLALEGTF